MSLPGGTTLFRQGERGDDVYIVVNGRVRTELRDADGSVRVLEEVGRGAAIGELGLLTGEVRAASVVAVRDSDLLRLPKAGFDALLERHPRAMLGIARAAALRLRNTNTRPSRGGSAPTIFAVVPVGRPRAGTRARARGSRRRSAAIAPVAHLAARRRRPRDRPAGRRAFGRSAGSRTTAIVAWLSTCERAHRHVVLEADGAWTPWTQRCLRQADRVLVVARAGGDPAQGARRARDARAGTEGARRPRARPGRRLRTAGRHRALARGAQRRAHHHVRLGHAGDVARLARRVGRMRDRSRARRRRRARLRAHRHAARARRGRRRRRRHRRHEHRRADRERARARDRRRRDGRRGAVVRVAGQAPRPHAAARVADGGAQGHVALPARCSATRTPRTCGRRCSRCRAACRARGRSSTAPGRCGATCGRRPRSRRSSRRCSPTTATCWSTAT